MKNKKPYKFLKHPNNSLSPWYLLLNMPGFLLFSGGNSNA